MTIRSILGNSLHAGDIFRKLYFFPRARFLLQYAIDYFISSKGSEWMYILSHLPIVDYHLKLLDIGGANSLLAYELHRRGYDVSILDQLPYQEKLRPYIAYYQENIFNHCISKKFDVITLVSTIEHFGLNEYGDGKVDNAQDKALQVCYDLLKEGGIILLTIPLSYGYRMDRVHHLISKYFKIIDLSYVKANIGVYAIKITQPKE